MKVLIIAWYFPPTNTIAAVRLGKMCKYLVDQGHEVRVITGKDLPFPQTLPLQISAEYVDYTRWLDPGRLFSATVGRFKRLWPHGGRPPGATGNVTRRSTYATGSTDVTASVAYRVTSWLSASYRGVLAWPDKQNGWTPYAVAAGRRMMCDWRPDLIVASGPPFSAFLIGYLLSRRSGVPWVAEYRDRWSDDPYDSPPRWLDVVNRAAEKRLVRTAAGIVTVSEPWAKTYREAFGKPVAVVYNGFDSDEPEGVLDGLGSRDVLRIVYTGGIYPGRRDPSPLFMALGLDSDLRGRVRIEFFGTDPTYVNHLAERYGVADSVIVNPPVTHRAAIEEQRAADVLLLMQWNDPKEQGNVPGKFFEYLGARRPILVLGLENGVPATILRQRAAGVCANEPQVLIEHLYRWLNTKRSLGHIPLLPETARSGFARVEQYRELEKFLERLLSPGGRGNSVNSAERMKGLAPRTPTG